MSIRVKRAIAVVVIAVVLVVVVWRVVDMFSSADVSSSAMKFTKRFVSYLENKEIGKAVEMCETKEKVISLLEVLAGHKFVIVSVKDISSDEKMKFGYFTKKAKVIAYSNDGAFAVAVYVSKSGKNWTVKEILSQEVKFPQ